MSLPNVTAASCAPSSLHNPLSIRDTTATLLRKVNDLAPLIVKHREAIARGPDLPEEIARALQRDGFTRLWLPREMGGLELPLADYFQIIEALSALDGSVGWCASIASTGGRIAGLMPVDRARELLGDGGFAAGSLAPNGIAERTGSGWRINGTWAVRKFHQVQQRDAGTVYRA